MGIHNRDYGREQSPWDRAQNPTGFRHWMAAYQIMAITAAAWLITVVFGEIGGVTDAAATPIGDAGGRIEDPNWIVRYFSLRGYTLMRPWLWWQWITYGFVHDPLSLWHLIGNMLGVWIFGRWLEERYGRWEFLRIYFVSMVLGGITGSLLYLYRGTPDGLTLGASGAVMALTVIGACLYPNRTLMVAFVIPVPVWILAAVYVLSNIAGALGSSRMPGDNTAYGVHMAGIAFGFAYYYFEWNLSFLASSRIAGLPAAIKQRSRRAKLKIHNPDAKMQRDEIDADRVLEKIHREGEASLTAAERRILNRYSKAQRARRRRT